MASTPIRLGSAAGTALIFENGSKISTSASGVQSCSIRAVYGDGQNIFSKIPAAGTPFNEVFGNNYLPSDFKVDLTGGGYDIEYIEGKAARVSINFKRPDPNDPPGPGGQRSRKVSVDSSITYQDLGKLTILGLGGVTEVGTTPDDSAMRYGFPNPVVTVTYNIDTQPRFFTNTNALFAQPGDARTDGFPELGEIVAPLSILCVDGTIVTYRNARGEFQTETLMRDYIFRTDSIYGPNYLGWKLTALKWEPHADESFFDVTETWQNYYTVVGSRFVSKTPV